MSTNVALQINIIDCMYLYTLARILKVDPQRVKYTTVRGALERARQDFGYQEAEDTVLVSSNYHDKSAPFDEKMRHLGFVVVTHDADLATDAVVMLRQGRPLKYTDTSNSVAVLLGELFANVDDPSAVRAFIVAGSLEMFGAIAALPPTLQRCCTFAPFVRFSDKRLYRNAELGTRYAYNGVDLYDMTPHAKALFGVEIGDEAINAAPNRRHG